MRAPASLPPQLIQRILGLRGRSDRGRQLLFVERLLRQGIIVGIDLVRHPVLLERRRQRAPDAQDRGGRRGSRRITRAGSRCRCAPAWPWGRVENSARSDRRACDTSILVRKVPAARFASEQPASEMSLVTVCQQTSVAHQERGVALRQIRASGRGLRLLSQSLGSGRTAAHAPKSSQLSNLATLKRVLLSDLAADWT
jgi:hypothetical protein